MKTHFRKCTGNPSPAAAAVGGMMMGGMGGASLMSMAHSTPPGSIMSTPEGPHSQGLSYNPRQGPGDRRGSQSSMSSSYPPISHFFGQGSSPESMGSSGNVQVNMQKAAAALAHRRQNLPSSFASVAEAAHAEAALSFSNSRVRSSSPTTGSPHQGPGQTHPDRTRPPMTVNQIRESETASAAAAAAATSVLIFQQQQQQQHGRPSGFPRNIIGPSTSLASSLRLNFDINSLRSNPQFQPLSSPQRFPPGQGQRQASRGPNPYSPPATSTSWSPVSNQQQQQQHYSPRKDYQ